MLLCVFVRLFIHSCVTILRIIKPFWTSPKDINKLANADTTIQSILYILFLVFDIFSQMYSSIRSKSEVVCCSKHVLNDKHICHTLSQICYKNVHITKIYENDTKSITFWYVI